MIIASNFKTNHTRKATREFVEFINDFLKDTNDKHQIRVYPSFTALDVFDTVTAMKVGAQNFYPVDKGSFTGEVGYEQLEEFGVDSVLVGHSERRHILGERQEILLKKFHFAKEKNLEIIYCIGEPQEVREAGIEAVMSYLWEQLEGIDLAYERLVVAYEPVWAIGTGLTASLEDIQETHARLRERVEAPILYGGSVKVENIYEVLSVKNCDGVLVGTASWEKESFCKMIELAQTLKA
jgi:triosephosphate isomerase